jgi:hypothetical protein
MASTTFCEQPRRISLNPADADEPVQSFTGDGKSNLEEYRGGTDLEVP